MVRSEDTKKQVSRMSNLKTNTLEATVTKQCCVGNPAERESVCSSHRAATSGWVCTDGDIHLPHYGNLSEKSVWIPQHPVLYLKYTQKFISHFIYTKFISFNEEKNFDQSQYPFLT